MAGPVPAGPVHCQPGAFQLQKPATDVGLDLLDGNRIFDGLHDPATAGGVVDAGGLEDLERVVLLHGRREHLVGPEGVVGVVDVAEEDAHLDGAAEVGQARLVDARLASGAGHDVGHEVRVGLVATIKRLAKLQDLVGLTDVLAHSVEPGDAPVLGHGHPAHFDPARPPTAASMLDQPSPPPERAALRSTSLKASTSTVGLVRGLGSRGGASPNLSLKR